jgi:hypothetical protein
MFVIRESPRRTFIFSRRYARQRAAQEQGAAGETPTPTLAAHLQTPADKLVSTMGNPDRYAAAICIRVRPDCLLLGYSEDESWRLSMLRKA